MEEKIEMEILPNGELRVMYSDKKVPEITEILDATVKSVQRASNVEWEPDFKGWTVRAAHDHEIAVRAHSQFSPTFVSSDKGFPIVSFEMREEAIAAEIKHFWELLPPASHRVRGE